MKTIILSTVALLAVTGAALADTGNRFYDPVANSGQNTSGAIVTLPAGNSATAEAAAAYAARYKGEGSSVATSGDAGVGAGVVFYDPAANSGQNTSGGIVRVTTPTNPANAAAAAADTGRIPVLSGGYDPLENTNDSR